MNQPSHSEIILTVSGTDYTLRTVCDDERTWYCAKDIQIMLKQKNVHEGISKMRDIFKCMKTIKTSGGAQRMSCISKEGFMDLLSRSRSIYSIQVAKQMGMTMHEHMPTCEERDNLLCLSRAFSGETMHAQFRVLHYYVDLYFPKYNLVIEFDEKFHRRPCQVEADVHRESEIFEHIGCTFIRFSNNDSIFEVINQVFQHIMATMPATTV